MIASSARVDDDARARGRLRIGHNLAIRHLTRAAFAPQLADRFNVESPTLHVGIGKVAAVGVGGKPSTELESAPFDESAAFATLTESKTLQAEQASRPPKPLTSTGGLARSAARSFVVSMRQTAPSLMRQ
jgi:hypothetical protein